MIVQLIVQLIMELVHFVVLSQMLSNLGVTMFIVRDDDIARISCRHTCLAVVLSREIALPVFFVLSDVLDAKRKAVVYEKRFSFK